ncbi:flagellar hook-associated protein FlgK [Clostridium sp.]|uniref:flagellar hook-associated protein FlgK n=1 Tax=Clostridium sp. TaxID=1506 RepID=UPI0026120C33|nr:flagellar hook-associated protein FlgK [Clostridium sp.]
MAGLLGTLNTAKSGMNVSQVAIQTTSHNISNINTPGYSRQQVKQTASSAYSTPGSNMSFSAGQIGTGAQINDVTRVRNTFYDYQFRSESHNYGATSVKYNYYQNIESIFNEPSDTAISSTLNDFFNSWNELAKDPNSSGVKNVVLESANNLAISISNAYDKLDSLGNSLNDQQDAILKDINSKISELKELDKNIKVIQGSGKSPNDLLDQRDSILDELSYKIDITNSDVKKLLETANADGRELTLDDFKKLGADKVSGELQGTISMQEDIQKYKDSLTTLADTVIKTVNDKLTGDNLFTNQSGKIISVSQTIKDNPDSITVTADEALKLYNTKNEKLTIGGKDLTINNFYNSIIQEVGQQSAAVIRDESNQSKLLSNIDSSRASVSGVSLDEEMINLIQFQHAYSASAKVLSTIDSLLDVVVNGIVK